MKIDKLASHISVIETKVKPIAELNQVVTKLDSRVTALENNPLTCQLI